MYSSVPDNVNGSNISTSHRNLITDNAMRFPEAGFSDVVLEMNTGNGLLIETPNFNSPSTGISNLPKIHEDSNNLDINNSSKSKMSPDSCGHYKYHQWQQSDIRDIRHQLLVQRTFSNHDDGREQSSCRQTHSSMSPYDNAISTQELQEIFRTPNRNQRHHYQTGIETGTSHQHTSLIMSPASDSSYGFTPGCQFVNPFELDQNKMQMSIFSPNMFKVTESVNKNKRMEKESFWSVEHAAMMMPVDIKETEINLQHRYQQRIDREQDARLQAAINKFFSNENIVPSPWSERVKHILPRTPGTVKSVSSQTVMSVPPHVDLFAKLEGKYLVPDYKTEPSPAGDSIGSSFIRRKLLNQLNDNDSEFGSPSIPTRTTGELVDSPSPIKQTTPEWEENTPNKVGSGHFSSSPIRQVPGENGHHHALYESDLLASPELSPIAGRSKTLRSSGIFYSHQDEGSPRPVMQLDFSSILEDQAGVDTETSDKPRALLHNAVSTQHYIDSSTRNEVLSESNGNEALSASNDHQFLTLNVSHDSDNSNNSKLDNDRFQRAALTSAFSTESTSDIIVTVTQSSQDTGYQTASLQTINQESVSNPNLTSQEIVSITSFNHDTNQHSFPAVFSSELFTEIRKPRQFGFDTNTFEEETKLRYKSNNSLFVDGSFLGFAIESSKEKSSSADDVALLRKKDESCNVRKVWTLYDMCHLKEKSSVSRDLTQSFNEELEKSNSNTATYSSWLEVNSDSCIPVTSKNISKNPPNHQEFSDSPLFFSDNQDTMLKTSDDNDNAHDVPNDFDVSMQSTSSYFNSSLEKKVLTVSRDINIPDKLNTLFEHIQHTKFSYEDDCSLKTSRQLLERSEKLRKRIIKPKALEADSLYQAISSYVENEGPLTKQNFQTLLKENDPRSQTSSFRYEPTNSSTPTSQMQGSVGKNIDQAEGSRLGSEIAAEILKRASEDLAKLTSLLACAKK